MISEPQEKPDLTRIEGALNHRQYKAMEYTSMSPYHPSGDDWSSANV